MPTDEKTWFPESVLFVVTRGDLIGGAQIHVRDLARALQNKGVRVAVACGSSGVLKGELDKTAIPFYLIAGLTRSIHPVKDLLAIKSLCRIIKAFQPTLISTHTAKAGMVGRIAALVMGRPVLFTAHGWQFAEGISSLQKSIVLLLEYVLARFTRRIITVSGYDKELAIGYHVASPGKIILVHNGMPWLDPCEKAASGIPKLLMVARFQPQKDHGTLFAALEKLKGLEWSLDLVGDGPDLEYWKKEVQKYEWKNRVQFLGQVLHVPELMGESDIFILSSLWEGFPRSILEAMRASLPVVCSDVGGVKESVIDGVTGYVVPPQDPQALAEKIGLILSDVSLRKRMGQAGRKRFEQEFTFDAMFEKTRQVWRSVI